VVATGHIGARNVALSGVVPVLLCDLGSVLFDVSFERALTRFREANGGRLDLQDPTQLRDDAYRAFETGSMGESEYARHLRVRLGWQGSDPDLVEIFTDIYGSIDVGVLEVLLELRDLGWHLIGVDNSNPWHESQWRRQYAEQLSVFHRLLSSITLGARKPDPRFFTNALRGVPAGLGPRLFVDDRPENVAAARRSGLDAHLFRGASGLRASCQADVLSL
jgi:putative hydrolase of the HAD superfamily